MGQCIPQPKHVLPVSRSVSGLPPKFNYLFIGPLPTFLKISCKSVQKFLRKVANTQKNKPVGFYGPIAPPVRGSVVRICGTMRTQHCWIRTSLSSTAAAVPAGMLPMLSVCGCTLRSAGTADFKMYLLHQFCSNRISFTVHR